MGRRLRERADVSRLPHHGEAIGLFGMRDEKGPGEKGICVPESDPGWSALESMDDLPEPLRQEIEHFFSVYTDLEQKHVEVHGSGTRATRRST